MYEAFFGLKRPPFTTAPSPDCLYLSNQHREAMAGLEYAICNRKGFVALIGEAGTGKTSIVSEMLQWFGATQGLSSLILNPLMTPAEFLEMILLDFGISPVPESKAQRLWKLQALLLEQHRAGRTAVLIVDEAHKLSPELLEELRLMGNFDLLGTKLIQIVLVGQNELDATLEREELRQLKQRIVVRLETGPLMASEIEAYIQFRWHKAGSSEPARFTPEALRAISAYSRGTPRLINSLCDNALLFAFADQSNIVTEANVLRAARDLRLTATGYQAASEQAAVPIAIAPPAAAVAPKPMRAAEGFANDSSRFSRLVGRLGLAR
jgi:general secretion pathway protein A